MRVEAYEADVDGKLDTDAGRDDQNDRRNCTQLDAEQTHQTEQLHDNHTKHNDLHTSDINLAGKNGATYGHVSLQNLGHF